MTAICTHLEEMNTNFEPLSLGMSGKNVCVTSIGPTTFVSSTWKKEGQKSKRNICGEKGKASNETLLISSDSFKAFAIPIY